MKKERLPHIGFGMIMVGFVYITFQLLTKEVPINVATWSMWVIIDTLLLVSMILAGNKRPWAMIGFEVLAVTVTCIALIKLFVSNGYFNFGKGEILSGLLVGVCLFFWKNLSGDGRVIAGTMAMYIAMTPTFEDQWQNPIGQDPWFWGVCSLGCLLEFIGKPKNIAQAFFPACATVANGVACILSSRQFW